MNQKSTARCVQCESIIRFDPGERLVKCPACDRLNLALSDESVCRYVFQPVMDETHVRIKFTHLMESISGVSNDFKDRATLEHLQLFFIPYYELQGVDISGYLEFTARKKASMTDPADLEAINTSATHSTVPAPKRVTRSGHQTLMQDMSMSLPGVTISEWGLEEVDISAFRKSNGQSIELRSVDMRKLQVNGRVIMPSLSVDAFLTAVMASPSVHDRLETIIHRDINLIYYPVYRLRCLYKNASYEISLDGMTGTLLYGRFPLDIGRHVAVFLGAIGSLGFLGGWVLAHIGSNLDLAFLWNQMSGTGGFAWIGIILGVIGLVLLRISWSNLQFPGDIVRQGTRRRIERIGSLMSALVEKMYQSLVGSR